ncbi:YraN family protein [Cylindrospermum sp. FACHB-282]|uniref:YraN family protein n=1 Tax=Cylindrospermum sp. FACHB-282 TaxID=2692794 RepID=UPI001682D63A|nr:YraN family protein [Cylindrospermum sp. FACHB-282]MBD2384134.1 YraN family protein [Cylindrospermum sp. FACHB-282]
MANPPPSHYADIGELGEDLVVQWLQSTGWVILHRRFSCPWGEIDIIAQHHGLNGEAGDENDSTQNSTLAFVEVKTRSCRNWDAGGRSAITLKKQGKICSTARIFLAQYPEKANYPCRFDVAIVYCQRTSKKLSEVTDISKTVPSLSTDGYKFKLQEYIAGAFDSPTES